MTNRDPTGKPIGRGGVALDSNLLLVDVLGLDNPALISKFKRTDRYKSGDFDRIVATLNRYQGIHLTPNVVTEVSNLATALPERYRPTFVARLAEVLAVSSESYVASAGLLSRPECWRFGVTDLGLENLARSGLTVLTADRRLASYLAGQGLPVVDYFALP